MGGNRFVSDMSTTIRANMGDNCPAVCYPVQNHPADSRVTIELDATTVQTLSARMGTGGGNTPLVLIYKKCSCQPDSQNIPQDSHY